MNLQINVRHQKCVYRCPMCVARSHKNENSFTNLYATNPKEWRRRLESTVKNGNYDAIVITGECDPTQDMCYVNDVINIIWNIRGITPNIEFTTHNQKFMNSISNAHIGNKIKTITKAQIVTLEVFSFFSSSNFSSTKRSTLSSKSSCSL